MHPIAKLDHKFLWHPFTQMKDWLTREPIVIRSGKGSVLVDVKGRQYLDANSSIWTNIHGHRNPKIDKALRRQLEKISHSSALGLASEPAPKLAARLITAAVTPAKKRNFPSPRARLPSSPSLTKVFFSDDGSTAMETGIKLATEFAKRTRGITKPRFLSLEGAYHGDSVGASSMGHIQLFRRSCTSILFKCDTVMSPYCYRCPFNKAKPEKADARSYRQCEWQCVDVVERAFARQNKKGAPYALFALEPLIQGAAGMIPQPEGWLSRVCEIARHYGTLTLLDEVMTGFGRATTKLLPNGRSELFAFQREGVTPDMVALAKGMTGGYLPMAATLISQPIFDAFLGEYEEFKTFFHGHSYTANQLGSAAALANLDLLESPRVRKHRATMEVELQEGLNILWKSPWVGDIRQVGLIVGVELVKNQRDRTPFKLQDRVGIRVCEAMAKKGVLTRPIGNVIVLMPPFSTTVPQLHTMMTVLFESLRETLG